MAKRDVVAVGGSAGSGAVLKHMLQALPKDLRASLFITTHVPSTHDSYLADMLSSAGGLPVRRAVDGQPIEPGVAYVAVRDRHLLLADGAIQLGAGPRENMVRPAIDPMFRSAALCYGPRTVGVVLTGLLNDGAAGLASIKQVGGTAIVQHPLDAVADEMPRAAIEAVTPDHVTRGDELAEVIADVVRSDAGPGTPPSDDLLFEVQIAAGAHLGAHGLRRFADPAPLTCPDCHGVLSQVKGPGPLRFRCQIGHAHTAEALAQHHAGVDEAIRIALRVMEERVELVDRMARDARDSGRRAVAELYEQRADEYRGYAQTLRDAALTTLRMGRGASEQPP
jgi:two-component system, chemotaxis family, protein-glutamate methylesterase/glutaminase